MTEFEEKIQKEKENYIKRIKENLIKIDYVVIYGAGKVGRAILNLCKCKSIKIAAFCVTDKSVNPDIVDGVPVIQLSELSFDKERTLILIGFIDSGNSSYLSELLDYGWIKYIDTPINALYYDDWMQDKILRPTLEITPKVGCGIFCKYCPQDTFVSKYYEENKNRTTYLTFPRFKEFLDKTPNDLIVEFAGFVEPFLNDECVEMMEYTNSTGREMTLYTTLVGLTIEKFERIKKLPFREVVLHTPDEDGHANIPMTMEYLKLLDLMLSTKKASGEPFINSANCQSKPHPKVLEHTKGKIKIHVQLNDRAGNLEANNELISKSAKGRITCGRAISLNHNILLPDGSVVLCCMDFGLNHILGNLSEQSYEEIMKSDELRYVKRCMNIDMESSVLCRKCINALNVMD